MNTIQSEWEKFEKDVIKDNVTVAAKIEMKKLFYCGALSLLSIIDDISNSGVSEEVAIKIIEGIEEECNDFLKSFIEDCPKGE